MKHTLIAAGIFAGLSGQALAATYQLTELPSNTGAAHTIISDANENGQVIGTASHIYNLPIDVSYINFDDSRIKNAYDTEKRRYENIDETITFTLEDVQNGAAATNADANLFMLSYLSNLGGSAEYQKLVDRIGVVFNAEFADEQTLFDVQSSDYDSLTRSVLNYLTAISDDGVVVGWGSAPFEKTQFTPKDETEEETFFVRDWGNRGLVITPSGEKVTLEPAFTEYGGASIATDIKRLDSGGYVVVGYSSVGIIKRRQDDYNDNCKGETSPIQACIWSEERRTTNLDDSSSFYELRAYQWTLNDSFMVTDAKEIGVGAVRRDDEDSNIYSVARATNKSEVTVGYSITRYDDNVNSLVVPGYFKDGQFVDISERDQWYKTGKAVDVNNSNIIVGYRGKSNRGKEFDTIGFYYDMTTQEISDIPAYFTGSETVINDINNTGYVVGQGEVEKSGSNRRREGFIYKIGDESVVNINSLLPCKDSNGEAYPYTIAEAIKITDSNTIYAIAVKTEERRNRLGEIETDSKGEVEYESVSVPVMLTPISGEVEDCAPPEAETYERQSGSVSLFGLLAMPIIWLRRRKLKLI